MTLHLDAAPAAIARAAAILAEGGLVAFPTETVYGLGADATNGRAVAGIYAAKGRPSFNPLIAHVTGLEAARRHGLFSADAQRLARAFWPGPLTLVVPKAPGSIVSDIATAGLDSLALRVPSHPVARAILAAVDRPVAAPSANRSGHVSPTAAAHVAADLDGRIDAIVDGGPTDVGVESTILACLDGRVALLRPGGVTRAAIEAVLGHPLAEGPEGAAEAENDAPLAPGMLASHYAPRARVRLDARTVRPGEAWLGFGPAAPEGTPAVARNLSPSGDLAEAAANLFGMLRALDLAGTATIAVAAIPAEGLGEAIRDRLARAAAQR
ncbi:L-threonylcarbamoyladenylate synthase [Labrys wisconsinensis]|uniref:Threonylcarbamoyl-AMP synthase n=1 Tax=Labrys wisconsinensis TaxID=425677 RepID=A0ABU0JBT6_9HYPH|nr:L-threonylcarbamoyladenylate synthase [Labrys wisconsinensis]MDQ0470612.1 L-threonylcarbamoyladenylate synthase [Labrys wisconsinensis]